MAAISAAILGAILGAISANLINLALNYAQSLLLFNSTAKQFSLARFKMNPFHLGANIWQL